MDVIFSNHSRFQMKRRGISKRLVMEAIYSKNEKQSYRGRKLRQLKVDDKILEVITRTEGSRMIVVTAYYLEGKL